MISLEKALARVLASVTPLETENISVRQAQGRVLGEDVASPIDLPLFDNSAMDGYAVRSEDLRGAAETAPVTLKLAGRIPAGESFPKETLRTGECARIFTGSPIPPGADAVVMQEDVTASGEGIRIAEPAKPFENIRLKGEDLRCGSTISHRGERVNPAGASVLTACGIREIKVVRQPRVALIATGNELREPGEPVRFGEIFESNRTLLAPLLESIACRVELHPIVRDDLAQTEAALRSAFTSANVVITTGGVSVGEFDFVKEAFARIGGKIDVWRVAVRPGKPFVFGTLGQQRLFGLPGNPVSALVTFLLMVRPALLKMQGCTATDLPRAQGRLTEDLQNRGDRRHFVRVRWHDGVVSVCGPQASHMISSLVKANALIDVPPGARLQAGAEVNALLWDR